jgi:hypothetical protein
MKKRLDVDWRARQRQNPCILCNLWFKIPLTTECTEYTE